ncbi:MAG: NAD(P)H-binding protein [Rothia sp. (in: high G+C Gram-positive bacteria)]|uniref:SDR family oxidoreductase n=1 Tax=Rothia sp. (in: high G+C Gram-positive bacteria) TaxID=1885016 RepID=UPI0026DBEFA1|nr:NAD(P)H-binding protein [Rothia sp. (in: high G+C Gram-positive bacteria)]MDO4883594.1 NAD(P)H-binding protein [Rothia sp. (in: high G+C Gram-positive bacteria)]
MKIAIVGATGTSGRATALAAQRAGHEVVALSRASGVDLHTGEGLAQALRGADTVIDTSNAFPASSDTSLVDAFAGATQRLVEASQQAGVQRLVHLSICNIDHPAFDDFDYYLAKRAQEKVLAASSLPHAIIRSAQWMEFALNPTPVTQTETEVKVQDWLIQPIAVDTVAEVLVQAAETPRDRKIAGHEQIRLPELTQAYLHAIGDHRKVTAVAPVVDELTEGIMLAPEDAELLGPTVAQWVAQQSANA